MNHEVKAGRKDRGQCEFGKVGRSSGPVGRRRRRGEIRVKHTARYLEKIREKCWIDIERSWLVVSRRSSVRGTGNAACVIREER